MATTILFVCNDNAGLSPMAEACLNAISDGSVRAFSAGLVPASHLAPATARVLAENGIPAGGLAPKSWELFALPHAPSPDMVIALGPDVEDTPVDVWPWPTRHARWAVEPGRSTMSPIEQARKTFSALRRDIEQRFAGCRSVTGAWRQSA
ncbi:hypothetical protein [Stappia sp. ES.058]|uniref:arsenate reductase/protein-tyrosine-phosphatase family protein n=1 Tax=Stappia sp. ES.058 TaxID=1881061 RepID=UPI00087C31B5|nr:hypothetical protein [Stappia sp. ES.058]SDU46987.1 Protein-tyrosine-phosphatase [Stappia sp. ES.058]